MYELHHRMRFYSIRLTTEVSFQALKQHIYELNLPGGIWESENESEMAPNSNQKKAS
jgi:hypothetical protein